MQGSTPALYSQYSQSASYEQSSQHPQLSPSTQSGQASQIQNAYSLQYASQLQQPYPYQFQPPTQLQQAYTFPYAPQLQVPLLDPQLQATSQPKKSVKSRNRVKVNQKGRTRNFTPKEDEALVKAWIAISGDGIIGNSQPGNSLWNRIYNTFNELLGIQNPEDDLDRSPNSLACRWTTIQHQVNKFCGYFATIDRNPKSGTNFDDRVEDAKKMFRACENSDFKMEELWKILRDNPKWNERNVAPKRKQNLEVSSPPNTEYIDINSTPQYISTTANSSIQHEGDGNPGTPGTNEDGSVRPKFGRKKAKEIKKRGINVDGPSSKPITEFMAKFDASVQQQLAISEKEIRSKEEMHRKDQEMKERYFQEMKEHHFHQKDELIRQQDQMMRQKQWQAEKEILEKDLRQMDCEQAEMFRKIQRDIWAKWQREVTLPL